MASSEKAAIELPASAFASPWARLSALLGQTLSRDHGNALIAFLVRVASAGILYLSQIILARWMGGDEYGVYVFVWTWVLVLGGLSHLGLPVLMIRLLPEYRETGQFDLLRGLLRLGRLIPLVSAVGVGLVAWLALAMFGAAVNPHYLLPATIVLLCVPGVALSDAHDGIGRGRGWLVAALVPPYVLRPLLLLIAMVVAHEIGLAMSAVTAASAAVACTWSAVAVQGYLVQKRLRADVPPGPRATSVKSWLGTSLPFLVISFSEIMLQTTDVLVVSQFMTPRDVGIYFAAAKTMSLVMFIHYAVGSAMAKRFAALNARGDRAGLAAAVRQAVNWTFWPSLLGALLILALGKPLLWLFGPQFEQGFPVMAILVVAFLARAAGGPSEFLLNMLGQQRWTSAVAIATALMNIGLSVWLVPRYGLNGAASATAISLVAAAVLNAWIARRELGLSIFIWHNIGRR